jgi:hypothetical protein
LEQLSKLVASNIQVKAIIDWLKQRERNPRGGKTTVMALSRSLKSPESNIAEGLKALADIGFGTYRPNRSLKDAFIVWKGNPVEIPDLLAEYELSHSGIPIRDESNRADFSEMSVELETHDFPVRPGVKLPIQIRLDMSDEEIKRMGEYLINTVAPSHSPST